MHAVSTHSAQLTDLALGDLVDIVGGSLRLADMPPRDGEMTPIERIVTDSRHVQPGDVYWAIPSDPNADCGCDPTGAACEALMRGAAGVVSSCRVEPFAGRWAIQVADPLVALWELARWRRDRFCGSVIAVCGADQPLAAAMIDCVLRSRLAGTSTSTAATDHSAGDADARVATPLALLGIDAHDDYAVVEVAESGASQAEAVAALCRPRIAVVTSTDATSPAARQTLERLTSDGFAVLSGDDAAVRRLSTSTSANVRTFGRRGDCNVAATNVEYRDGTLRFDVDGVTIRAHVWGRHHLHAALAAYAVGRILEFTPHEIAAALAAFVPPPGRCDVTHADGLTIIQGSRPTSKPSLVALELLRETAAEGRRFVVCGDDDDAVNDGCGSTPSVDAAHTWRAMGQQIVTRAGADRLVAFGGKAREIVAAAQDAGMPLLDAVACEDANEAARHIANESRSGDVLLFQSTIPSAVTALLARRTDPAPLRRAA